MRQKLTDCADIYQHNYPGTVLFDFYSVHTPRGFVDARFRVSFDEIPELSYVPLNKLRLLQSRDSLLVRASDS